MYTCEELTHWKRLWCWERLGAGEVDPGGWDGWMASSTHWTWVWVNSGSWWWTGRPGVLWFMGFQRVGHDWATELNWTDEVRNSHCYYQVTFLFDHCYYQVGLPRWLGSEEFACQCNRSWFNPWVRKMPWRRAWQPIPIFVSRKSRGPRCLVGYSPQCNRVRHDWSDLVYTCYQVTLPQLCC